VKEGKCFKHMPRTRFERWLNLHNHKMELMRTIFAAAAFIIALAALIMQLKVLTILLSRG